MSYPEYFATGNIPFPAHMKPLSIKGSGSFVHVDDEIEYFFKDQDEAQTWLTGMELIAPEAWLSWENDDYHPVFRGPTVKARATIAIEFYRGLRDAAQDQMDHYQNQIKALEE